MLLCALAACSARHALPPAIPAPPPHVDPEVAAPEPPDPPGRVVVTDTEVHVLEPVRFAPNSAELTPGAGVPLVRAVLMLSATRTLNHARGHGQPSTCVTDSHSVPRSCRLVRRLPRRSRSKN